MFGVFGSGRGWGMLAAICRITEAIAEATAKYRVYRATRPLVVNCPKSVRRGNIPPARGTDSMERSALVQRDAAEIRRYYPHVIRHSYGPHAWWRHP